MKTPGVKLGLSLFIVLWHPCCEDLLSSFVAFTFEKVVDASSPPDHLVLIESVLSIEVIVCSVLNPHGRVNLVSFVLTENLNLLIHLLNICISVQSS